MSFCLIILAAGNSSRFRSNIGKPYQKIGGKSLIEINLIKAQKFKQIKKQSEFLKALQKWGFKINDHNKILKSVNDLKIFHKKFLTNLKSEFRILIGTIEISVVLRLF